MEPAYPQKTSTIIDFDYCILCQETGNGELTVPGEKGTNKLKEAMMRRKKLRDSKNRDAIERLKTIMDPSHETSLRWHRMCYSHYSHKKAKFKDYISHWKRHCNHQGQAHHIVIQVNHLYPVLQVMQMNEQESPAQLDNNQSQLTMCLLPS